MAQTIAALIERGLPLPYKVFASSWGAPHVRYHGRLNSIAIESIEPVAEVNNACIARLGRMLKPEMARIAAEALMTDVRLQRTYPLNRIFTFPMPVVAIGWDLDDIVPPAEVWPSAWAECASTVYHLLPGDHWEFMSCPRELRDLIATEMNGAFLVRSPGRSGS
jgi:surfactin synthase thioesterase subunit